MNTTTHTRSKKPKFKPAIKAKSKLWERETKQKKKPKKVEFSKGKQKVLDELRWAVHRLDHDSGRITSIIENLAAFSTEFILRAADDSEYKATEAQIAVAEHHFVEVVKHLTNASTAMKIELWNKSEQHKALASNGWYGLNRKNRR